MVVKELRQGLRMRSFGGIFVTLHILLVLITLMGGASSNHDSINWLFDGLITTILCLIFPLRGFAALAQEMNSGTLDMLVLTRLSAWRIVLGKWASTVLLALLVAVSLVPYVVSRYMFGGVDLAGEIGGLFLKWLGGAVLTAAIVCLSTIRQQWLRSLIIGIPLIGFGFFGFLFSVVSTIGGSSRVSAGLFGLSGFSGWLLVPLALWVIFGLLGAATTRISPLSSLFPAFKRVVHLTAVLIVLTSASFGASAVAVQTMLLLMLHLIMVDVVLENNGDVPSVHAAFVRRGRLGRVAAWFFTPGWTSGFFFTLGLVGLITLGSFALTGVDGAMSVWFSACFMWLIASLVQLASSDRSTDRLATFAISILCVSLVSALISGMISGGGAGGSASWMGVVLPSLVPLAAASASGADREMIQLVGLAVSCLWPLLHLLQCLRARRRMRPSRLEALELVRAHPTAS